tara:strand:+ start:11281 stop:11688 length:408 start_codon:yes stop_codon:yes gene_type:complete
MQKVRLQNFYNKDTNSFDKNNFELRESDKSITGKLSISSKKDDKWHSKAIPFIAYKSQIDNETTMALLHSKGQLFEAEINLSVDIFRPEGEPKYIIFFKAIVNKAKFEGEISKHSKAKGDAYVKEEEFLDDEIVF